MDLHDIFLGRLEIMGQGTKRKGLKVNIGKTKVMGEVKSGRRVDFPVQCVEMEWG
jgi:hypothetical protein